MGPKTLLLVRREMSVKWLWVGAPAQHVSDVSATVGGQSLPLCIGEGWERAFLRGDGVPLEDVDIGGRELCSCGCDRESEMVVGRGKGGKVMLSFNRALRG